MATKYANFDLATGNNDGSDWTNAWKTMADAIAGTNSAPPAAGDTVYCKGTDTLAAGCVLNLVGTEISYIRWIGVNASGTNDGTRATLDCNGGNFPALQFNAAYCNSFDNFRFTGSVTNGVASGVGASYYLVFNNCSFDNNGSAGINFTTNNAAQYNTFVRCVFYGNDYGFITSNYDRFFFSCFHDNVSAGLYRPANGTVFGCVFYDNPTGLKQPITEVMIQNVFDGNTTGFENYDGLGYIGWFFGNRITNNTTGLDGNTRTLWEGWNDFDGNTDHRLDTNGHLVFLYGGLTTNVELNENGAGGGDTLQGYVSTTEGSEDYSTNYVGATDPHLRRTAITIPTS